MHLDDYRRAPETVDMAAEERAIRRDTSIATAVTLAGFGAAFWIGPAIADLPSAMADRLGFAAMCWAVPGFVLLVGILMVSTTRRFSPEDIGGQAARPPSERLAIKAAFLQNTLEQTVLAAGVYFALAAVAGGAWLALLPVAAGLFVIGRVLFYIGYPRGAQGRALGMGLTMMPAALGYPLVLGLALFGG
ncbi:MAPEG family protein [Pararhodobacter sp. SW119]|uniref:MAPEG family protein n=1 Tax=Pararhodobacter sp. SW119 TaxID=2780075 RepID=UPI001ADFE29B|nr:MAPEG family protein [Pararhodobacter sp. SW119]